MQVAVLSGTLRELLDKSEECQDKDVIAMCKRLPQDALKTMEFLEIRKLLLAELLKHRVERLGAKKEAQETTAEESP